MQRVTLHRSLMGSILSLLGAVGYLWITSVVDLHAQITPILKTDIRAATHPNYGCDSWTRTNENTYYTETRVAGGSPSGNDSVRIVGIQTNDLGDFGIGCRFTSSLPGFPAQGSVRYARWRMKYNTPINWRSDNCNNSYCANNRTSPDKLFILGNLTNDCPTSAPAPFSRIIAHQYAFAPSRSEPILKVAQGTTAFEGGYEVPSGIWLSVQVAVHSSSTYTATDAYIEWWINNNNQGAPDKTFSLGGTMRVTTHGWGPDGGAGCEDSQIVFGDGSYNTLSDDDVSTNANAEYADFEYDDEFDPNWYPTAGDSSAKPRRLRFVGPGGA